MAGWEVRPSDPGRTRRVRLCGVLLVLAIPLAFYLGGWWQARTLQLQALDQQALQQRVAEQQDELELLNQQLAVVGSGGKLAQQANEQSRLTIKLLEEQIYKQQQDLAFYKGVLAPASRREGLRIRTFEVQGTETPRLFRYKILLSRVGKGDKPLTGHLQVTLVGRQAGREVTLELAALTAGLADALAEQLIPFRFKHFQSIPEAGRFAELKLPKGFVPREIKVQAEVKGEKPLLRTFKWGDQE